MEKKPMYRKRGLDEGLMCRRTGLKYFHHEPNFKQRAENIQIADLPHEVICRVLSKLPLKEVVRTSILSNTWKHMWKIFPRLRFDGLTMCGQEMCGTQQHTHKFADNVNAILQQCQGKVFEEIAIKIYYDNLLVDHLDSWVRLAVSSLTKNLALDLAPAKFLRADLFGHLCDRYKFPLEFFESKSLSHLQHIQFSFISLELPPQFSGFPNLRKLELHLLQVTQKDLQDMLSSCRSLEWLCMVRCHLNDDEMKVALPLSNLLYLQVECCNIISIELSAANLRTLIYSGYGLQPICNSDALEVTDATLFYIREPLTLKHALTVLPNDFPCVQNLILYASIPLKKPRLQEHPLKFSQLKYLQLRLLLQSNEEPYNIISLASFLSAAPLIGKFELHVRLFTVRALSGTYSVPIGRFPCHPYNHLKNLCITGFSGCLGQLEFLIHCVENAPVLEILTIDPANLFVEDTEYERQTYWLARELARRCLDGVISPNTKLCIM